MGNYAILLMLCMTALGLGVTANYKIWSVLDFGAAGDGRAYDTEAFQKAWEAVCGFTATSNVTLTVPAQKTFLVNPLRFEGPCKSPMIHIEIQGNIIAPREIKDWATPYMGSWVVFTRIQGLIVDGNGQIDGQGSNWWKCAKESWCPRPYGWKFDNCDNFRVSHLNVINSPSRFLSISSCNTGTISDIDITNPEDSPNTDGMDITHSTNIQVTDCNIRTGDDCIAILSGCSNINITGIACGPGHGISIGSLGSEGSYAKAEEIHVKNVIFNGSTSGARIKTWQGGQGYVRKISYKNITVYNVDTPILIDQYYFCRENCNQTSALSISDISYIGVQGTSLTDKAISLNCSQSVACTNIVLDHINITSADPHMKAQARCINAHGKASGTNPPVDCLLQ